MHSNGELETRLDNDKGIYKNCIVLLHVNVV